ncbi:hypothetical protein KC343_g356 [Hortaea werneckii]|nr:hypothetical protein KC352_g8252 [Hortaea werneckii]KAI7572829.1 hypothetical protein KC317_g412 [Hortaea werneckii]KAI7628163.1 hypothetical protein KC346_g360 [Hortaea werneckii]KAI7638042.1 hypothetical protein KC343_g356 [Hortaea werneckii]KAI7683693.1 hypothetical protein KC319_g344 [Hortaea werneckii]
MTKRKASEIVENRRLKAARNTEHAGSDGIGQPDNGSLQSQEASGLNEFENTEKPLQSAADAYQTEPSHTSPTEDERGLKFLLKLIAACEQRRMTREPKLRGLDQVEEGFIPTVEEPATKQAVQVFWKDRLRVALRELSGYYNTDLAGERRLMMLPPAWFTDLQYLQQHQSLIRRAEHELSCLETELEKLHLTLSGQLSERTRRLLKPSKEAVSPAEVEALRIEIEETTRSIQNCHLKKIARQHRLTSLLDESDEDGERLLEIADSNLVPTDLLIAEQDGHREKAYRDSDRERDDETSQPHLHNQAFDKRGQYENPEDHLAILQDESSRYLAEAKRAFSQASKAFRNVRETYDKRYEFFRNDVEAGRIIHGTKTSFDAEYFLERNRLNRRLTAAEEQWWAARKDAQRTGALPLAHHTSDFADRSDDGHTSREIEAYIASFDMERIERWRSDGAQKDIEQDESKWEPGLPDYEAEIASVAVISSTSQDRYDTSRRSKLIARWRKEQEDTRKIELRRWRKTMKG